ncbi:MAG: DUF4349 domain-containing protein [Planctomycetota bacterium]|nr:DUF4349 domain-containing protein [Planctomycetota bacterium]
MTILPIRMSLPRLGEYSKQDAFKASDREGDREGGGEKVAEAVSRKLIYTADVRLASDDIWKVADDIEKVAEQAGGYLLQRRRGFISVRVPAGKYKDALSKVSVLGVVLSKDESAEDVTEKFFDLETRLKARRNYLARLEELSKQAFQIEALLAIQREISKVIGEIEQLEGILNRLSHLVSFSTIKVTLESTKPQQQVTQVRCVMRTLPFYWVRSLRLERLLESLPQR